MRLNSMTTRRAELANAAGCTTPAPGGCASGGSDQIVWRMTPGGTKPSREQTCPTSRAGRTHPAEAGLKLDPRLVN
jgi:hypothetical protein